MRLLLLNQYSPDFGAPTGRILAELRLELQWLEHEITYFKIDSSCGRSCRELKNVLLRES
jgi:hypothetical protein